MAITRLEMRRDIARQMNDLLTLTVDTGSENMLSDPVELTDADNTFVGSQGVVVSAQDPLNIGKVVRVRGNSFSGASISFVPALPSPLVNGDVVDLHNLRGRGFRVQDYNEQIVNTVRKHATSAPREAISDPFIFDMMTPVVPIPDDWIAIYGVSVELNGQSHEIHAGRYDGARGWRVDMTGRQVEISGSDASGIHGLEVTLFGYRQHPPVNDDSDPIYLNPEFVSLTVMSNLAQRRGDQHQSQWAAEWARMAAGVRPGKIPSWAPNTIMLEVE